MDRRTGALLWLYAFVFVAMLGFACFSPTSYRPLDIGVLRGRSIPYSPQHQDSLKDLFKGKTRAASLFSRLQRFCIPS